MGVDITHTQKKEPEASLRNNREAGSVGVTVRPKHTRSCCDVTTSLSRQQVAKGLSNPTKCTSTLLIDCYSSSYLAKNIILTKAAKVTAKK